jgi:starvation-inducible DNA-binding protein
MREPAGRNAPQVKELKKYAAEHGVDLRAIEQIDELGDKDMADIFTEISRGVDKYLWFVEAHLG